MRTHEIKQVDQIALADISEYVKSTKKDYKEGFFYHWVVMASHLNTAEVRRLNRELGVSNENYLGNENWKFMKRYKI